MRAEHKEIMKARARNLALVVAYDGTAYHGFQRQTPPVVAVQNILESRLALLFGEEIEMAAAGRTDAGVHAYGQVVNFFTDGRIPTARIARASEGVLPPDIVVRYAAEVPRDFSARHSARRKTYLYRLHTGAVANPFLRHYAWHVPTERRPLDAMAMQEAANLLLGTHNFSSFRATGGAPMSPVRTMERAEIRTERDGYTLLFRADGFLYHMVRNIVGTLVDVGRGVKTVARFGEILASHDRGQASPTAPAQGLYLAHVEYDDAALQTPAGDTVFPFA